MRIFRGVIAIAAAVLMGFMATTIDAAELTESQEARLRALARGEAIENWPGLTEQQSAELAEKAQNMQDIFEAHNLPYGQVADLWWADKQRSRPLRYEGIGDSAYWNGMYLATLSFRYAAEPTSMTRVKILGLLDTFDKLSLITGKEGYVARFAGPMEDEAFKGYYSVYGRGADPERPGFGKKAFRGIEPWQDEVWLGHSSRDTYIGVNMGLAMALDLVEDVEVQARTRELIERITDTLIEDGFHIKSPKGNVTRPTPTYKLAWMRMALSANPQKYTDLKKTYLDEFELFKGRGDRLFPITGGNYYVNVLNFNLYCILGRLEEDPERNAVIDEWFTRLFNEGVDHLNAYLAAAYIAATGDVKNETALAVLQGLLVDFPEGVKWGRDVDYTHGSEIELRPGGEFARYALLPSERPVTDFIWQRSPVLARDIGRGHVAWEHPSLDVFMPYWMGRAMGAIPAP